MTQPLRSPDTGNSGSAGEQVNNLMKLHYKARSFLDIKDWDGFNVFAHPYTQQGADLNEMKIILILTQSLANFPALKETISLIQQNFDQCLQKLTGTSVRP